MAKPFWHILSFFHRLLKFRMVPLIHDIDDLKEGSDSVRLATCDVVISHNPQMTKYLTKYMSQDKIKNIKCLITSSHLMWRIEILRISRGVIYTGNLSGHKCSFIYILKDVIFYSLWCPNYEDKKTIPKYLGSFDAQSPEKISLRENAIWTHLGWDSVSRNL